MAQVNRRGDNPASSPALEAAIRRKRAADRKPTDADRPPISTLPGSAPERAPGQIKLNDPGAVA